MNILTSFLCIF